MMADRFIGKAEAAELLGISPATLDRLAAAGEVPKYKIGGQCRYYEAELISYAKAQRVVPVVAVVTPPARRTARAGKIAPRRGYVPGMKVV